MTGTTAVAGWTGPAIVVAVVARVTLGGVDAPLFVLAVLAAPLIALLVPPPCRPPSAVALPIALVVTVCILGSAVHAVTALGRVAGWPAWAALAAAITLVCVPALPRVPRRAPAAVLGVGVVALVSAVAGFGHAVHAFPWTAWSRVASRGVFELGPDSAWTGEGFRAVAPVSFTSTDAQRIRVMAAGVYRVTEHDRAQPVVREWRLASGDSLALRPGDVLAIPAGGRVQFESGARLPSPATSGTSWADGAPTSMVRARSVAGWATVVITLVGGALVVVRPLAPLSVGAAVVGPVAVLAVVSAAAAWAIHAVDLAPELAIGTPPGASLASLVPAVVAEPWRSRVAAALVVALIALFVAAATALHQRLGDLVALHGDRMSVKLGRPGVRAGAWVMIVTVAGVVGVWIADGWSLLMQGMGLGAAVVLGPLLATWDAADARRASIAGAVAGALVFIGALHATGWLTTLPAVIVTKIAHHPALVAVPAAWLVATAVRAVDGVRPDLVAAPRRH